MSGLFKPSEENALSSRVGILSDEDRVSLTQQTTDKYAAELEELLIPLTWRKKSGRAANLIESFYHAFHGIWIGLKHERNLRIHFCLVPIVAAFGVFLRIDSISWLVLVLTMGAVVTTELLNTALEHVVDLTTDGEYHISARYAKDTAAAAVLSAAVVALITGLSIFVPRILALINPV